MTKQLIFRWIFILMASFPLFIGAQPTLKIWEIQGDGNESPYVGQFVTTLDNIVTAVGNDFFVIQTPTERSDNNDLTSDGIIIFLEDNTAPTVDVGDRVNITGLILDSPTTYFTYTDLEITVLSSNSEMPAAIKLDEQFPSTSLEEVLDLESVECMLVELDRAAITSPSNEYGNCFLSAATNRPMREAGIEYPGINDLPVWDYNPENIWFIPNGLGLAANEKLSAGMSVSSEGVIVDTNFGNAYAFLPKTYQVEGNPAFKAARPKQDNEFSVGCINGLFFESDAFDYEDRLVKFTNYIINQMRLPDVIAFQEIGTLDVLEDLAEAIKNEEPDYDYSAYLEESSFINTGYLIRNTLSNIRVSQLGQNESLSIGGRMHDRPPLLLEAELNTTPPTPIQIINVHMRSLNGITGSDANFVRTKRHESAISIAKMIKAFQVQNKEVIMVGDFNAFEFSDGYVDVMRQITGQSSEGALFEIETVLEEKMINHVESVEASERYSYVYQGNAQVLDHCISTPLENVSFTEMQFIRGNADNPEYYFDKEGPYRISDHDGFVAYFDAFDELNSIVIPPELETDAIFCPNPFNKEMYISFNLENKLNLDYELVTLDGKLLIEGTFESVQREARPLPLPSFPLDNTSLNSPGD